MQRRLVTALTGLVLLALAAGSAVAPAAAERDRAGSPDRRSPPVELADARLKFEINDTDGDGGVQVFLDGEQWRWLTLSAPNGRTLLTTRLTGRMARQGGTELFLESAEPSFDDLSLDQLLARFPEGDYHVRGRDIDGNRMVGTATLTHDVPDGPRLLSPIEGDGLQDPAATELRWERVGPAGDSPIVGYQVLVVQEESDVDAIPKIAIDLILPPTADRLVVPPEFLRPGTEYEWEVLAIEAGGNQTLSASFFTTAG